MPGSSFLSDYAGLCFINLECIISVGRVCYTDWATFGRKLSHDMYAEV